jgi:hypothetical protein
MPIYAASQNSSHFDRKIIESFTYELLAEMEFQGYVDKYLKL